MKKCKYEIKKNKIENLTNSDLDASSSDKESDNESNDWFVGNYDCVLVF